MDPDTGDYPQLSHLYKITLLTFLFTTGYFHRIRQNEPLLKLIIVKKDTVVILSIEEKPSAKKKKKTIYLSFDNGPNKGTQNVLNIINQEEIPATLFVVGEHVYGSRHQAKVFDSIINNRFIEIANHSYTHAFHNSFAKYYSLPDSVVKDFKRCADSLRLGSSIIRTTGRNIWRTKNILQTDIKNCNTAADSLQNNGFTMMGWDLEWCYDNQLQVKQTTKEMASREDSMFTHGLTKTPGHLVLLAHDQVYSDSKDSASLHNFINTLKEKGEYEFSTISKYPGIYNSNTTESVYTKK